jgi:hypothetical protein
MKIKFTEVGSVGADGEHYRFEVELDVADADEAYVKAREFERLTSAIVRGTRDEWAERTAGQDGDEEDET